MPALTQEELDELSDLGTVEGVNGIQHSANDTPSSGADEGAEESSGDAEMKYEMAPDVSKAPSEAESPDQMNDEPVDEFVEAAEHPSPDMLEEQSKKQNTEVDVAMKDVDEDDEDEGEEDEDDDDDDDESENNGDVVVSGEAQSEVGDDEDEQAEEEASDSSTESEQNSSDGESVSNTGDENDAEEADKTDESDSESSSEAESDSDEDEDDTAEEKATSKRCPLCNRTEEVDNDERLVECSKCGAHAHEGCVQEYGALQEDVDQGSWQCQNCSKAGTSQSPKDATKRNRNSAPRLVRDLLPVSRGVQKPNSHSIFAQPLISEGDDGGRALRKRKSPTVEPPSEKRRRKATPKALPAALPDVESLVHTTRRASQKAVPTARILQYRPYEKAPPYKFILAFKLNQEKIEKVLSKPSRPGRRRDRRRPPKIPPPPIFHPPVPKFPALPTNHLIFPSMWGDRESEANAKPYGGILAEPEADTSRSLPLLKDRELFEIARKEAEEERRKTSAAAEAEINGENANIAKPNRTVSGPPSKIKCIQFGKHVIDTFYAAPYPEEYSHESRLFICEFCLKYLPSEFVAWRHKLKCPAKHPPGDEIYRDGTISIWEVDGRKKTEYCQCLCLMAKMFLGSKTLYYDVEPFLFYILTEYDEYGYHFVGYFSKEKRPASQNNVSCILVMPIHQRKGYATFLIDFSYLLTRIEGKDGSPEKPLSDMGLTAYRSYWDLTIASLLLEIGLRPFSTRELMQRTGMTADDVVHSLERLYAFVKDPVTKIYAIRYDQKLYENIVTDYESKKHRKLRPGNLIWTPYIMGRSDQAHLDTQPVQTIAPREGDEATAEELESQQTKSNDGKLQGNEDEVSPKTSHDPIQQTTVQSKDPLLVNGAGHVAPGPPSAQLLTGNPPSKDQTKVNGVVNGEKDQTTLEGDLSGYALAFRNGNIPPNRFQIDPPIPPSMLRARSHRKRNVGRGRHAANGNPMGSPAVVGPVRSSPRHAASTNGSVNGTTDNGSPEKPSTPIRRSSRKSGLSNMETVGLDGSVEPDELEVGDEIEAKVGTASETESSSEDDNEEESAEEEEAEENDDEDEDDDEDVEVPEEEEEEDEDDEEADDDDDPEALDIVNESDEDEESDDD